MAWPGISIPGCKSKYVLSTRNDLQAAKFDQSSLDAMARNRNRKTLYSWLVSIKDKGERMPSFYARAGSPGSAMSVQGRFTAKDFADVVSVYKKMDKANDVLKSPEVQKRARKLVEEYETKSGERVDLSTISTTGLITDNDRMVVTAYTKETAVAGSKISGWSTTSFHLVEGCLITVNSFMHDKMYSDEDFISYAASIRIKKQ